MSAPGSTRRWRAFQIGGVILAMATIFSWNQGYFRERIRGSVEAKDLAPRFEGPTGLAERRRIAKVVEVAGTVRASRSASVSSRVVGVVARVLVEEGARVRSGETLAHLSAPDLDSRGAAARGTVETARAALEQTERDVRRIESLHERGAATRLEREQAETALRQASGGLARAVGESQATTSVAGYASLVAPFDGVVTQRWLDPGDLASPGVPVLAVVDDSSFRVEAEVAETIATALRVGVEAEVVVDALDGATLAQIVEIVPAADPRTRTVLVKLDLPRQDELRSGAFARVRLPIGEREGVIVPRAAVRAVGELRLVDVISPEGVLEPRHVELGREVDEASIEVLAGVAAGERVAVRK